MCKNGISEFQTCIGRPAFKSTINQRAERTDLQRATSMFLVGFRRPHEIDLFTVGHLVVIVLAKRLIAIMTQHDDSVPLYGNGVQDSVRTVSRRKSVPSRRRSHEYARQTSWFLQPFNGGCLTHGQLSRGYFLRSTIRFCSYNPIIDILKRTHVWSSRSKRYVDPNSINDQKSTVVQFIRKIN